MADVTIRDTLVGEKKSGDPAYTQTKIDRPRVVYNSQLPNLGVGHLMKLTMEIDTGGGFVKFGSVTYAPEIAPDSGKVVHPVITFDNVEMTDTTL